MAQKHRFHNQRGRSGTRTASHAAPAEPRPVFEKKPPTIYGKPIIVLEDESKSTFEFQQGAWIPFSMNIAECRRDCLVKELPQKVNRMTRYEVRCPVRNAD